MTLPIIEVARQYGPFEILALVTASLCVKYWQEKPFAVTQAATLATGEY